MNKVSEKNEQLSNYFDNFSSETIKGSEFKFLPNKRDVPIIKQIGYDDKKDIFEIVFEFDVSDKLQAVQRGPLVLIENLRGTILALQILNFKKQKMSSLKIDIDSTIRNELRNITTRISQGDKDVNTSILEKRKVSFIKDFLIRDIGNLSKNIILKSELPNL